MSKEKDKRNLEERFRDWLAWWPRAHEIYLKYEEILQNAIWTKLIGSPLTEEDKKQIIMSFYIARTIYSSLGIKAAQKKISSCFPDNLIETDVTFQSVSSYSTRKEKKKAEKRQKRAAKIEKRSQKKDAKKHSVKNREA